MGLDLHGGVLLHVKALGLDGSQVVKVLAHHGGHQLHAGQVGHGILTHQGAVAQYGDAVAHRIDLLQEVGHEHDAHALLLQLEHHFKQLFHLAVVQGGGGLVQDQHLTVHVHRPGNGDHLLDGQGVVLQVLGHIHLDVQPLDQLVGLAQHLLAVDGVEGGHGLPPDVQVFRHAQVGAQVDLLIHGGDAHLLGVQGGVVLHRALHAVHPDLTGLKVVDAGQALDEGGFSGAVFPHQGVDLALAQGEVHIAQRLDPREGHADAPHGQYNVFFHLLSPHKDQEREDPGVNGVLPRG